MFYTKLAYHIVFGTKRRERIITPDIQTRVYKYLGGIINNLKGIPVEINGTSDHVHILAYVSPVISISDFMRITKSNSSKWINELPDYTYNFRWQSQYGAFSVSESQIQNVKKYIQNQEQHHLKISWEEEFIQLLKEHGIKYDEKYLWD